jgi:hypothetical protein
MPLDPGILLLQHQMQAILQHQQQSNPYLNSLYFQSQAALPRGLLSALTNGGLPPHNVLYDLQARYLAECTAHPSERPVMAANEQPANDTKPAALATISCATQQEIDIEDDAVLALSALAVSNLPKFTEEQVAQERASMTEAERAEILADMFGKFCNVECETAVHSPPDKRARKDLDAESVAFLVQYMRGELAKIPDNQKQALLEAQAKCDAKEFCDERLERFLRCEGMNVKVRSFSSGLGKLLKGSSLTPPPFSTIACRRSFYSLLGSPARSFWFRQVYITNHFGRSYEGRYICS